MARDLIWLRKLVEAYLDPRRHLDLPLEDDDPRYPLNASEREGAILSEVFRLAENEPEECWRFIEIACDMPLSEDQLGLLGAGLFENLMDAHGEQFINRIEQGVRDRSNLQLVVDAVWTMSMEPYVGRAFKTLQTHRGKRRG